MKMNISNETKGKEGFTLEKNDSYLLIPFYSKYESKKLEQLVLMTDLWEKEKVRDYYYLAKHINAVVNNKSKNICTFYRLKDSVRTYYGLPAKTDPVNMKSKLLKEMVRDGKQTWEEFEFYLSEIRVIYFTTGIGFLILEIQHGELDSPQTIADKCFSLTRIFTNEHDSEKKDSNIEFSFSEGEQFFSLKNSVMELLRLNEVSRQELQLFPSMPNKRCTVFHRIIMDHKQEGEEQLLYYLRRSLHSSSLYSEWNTRDVTYSPIENIHWSICQNGIVSLCYMPRKESNNSFIKQAFPRNVKKDYFFLYILLLHKREALLLYNAEAVMQWSNPRKLVAMRKKLIEFNVCYTYNTVSVETAYQIFYDCVYQSMCLDKLEMDIRNVIDQVEEYQQGNSDARMNGMLAVIALLSIFSTFLDGYELSETIQKYQSFSFLNWISIGINLFAVVIAIMIYFHKK
jgi:hypothetical protein